MGDRVKYLLEIADKAFQNLKLEFKEVFGEWDKMESKEDVSTKGDEPYALSLRGRLITYLKV